MCILANEDTTLEHLQSSYTDAPQVHLDEAPEEAVTQIENHDLEGYRLKLENLSRV